MPHPHATFPGLQIESADMAFSTGVQPSACGVVAVPTAVQQEIGPLVLGDGVNFVTFTGCAIDKAMSLEPTALRGQRILYRILDRRWRWRGISISGRYNVRLANGTIDDRTAKTFSQLLSLLLDSLGETGYTIGPYDSMEPPEIHWRHANVTAELSRLCDMAGYRVVLRHDTNSVEIVENGQGPLYPPTGLEKMRHYDQAISALPKYVDVAFGQTRYEQLIQLEPVGMDTDGTIKPIDSLSYKPTNGWAYEDPLAFMSITSAQSNALAKMTVHRWFKVKQVYPSNMLCDGTYVTNIDNILPLCPSRLSSGIVGSDMYGDEEYRARDHAVFGTDMYEGRLDGSNSGQYVLAQDTDYTLDCERGIVKFHRPRFAIGSDNYIYIYPYMFLLCGFHLQTADSSNRVTDSLVLSRATGLLQANDNGFTATIRRPDLYHRIVQTYTATGSPYSVEDNLATLNAHADDLATMYKRNFSGFPQATQSYAGIIPWQLSGNLPAIRWLIGNGPPTTIAYKNSEHPFADSYSIQRRDDELRRLICSQ